MSKLCSLCLTEVICMQSSRTEARGHEAKVMGCRCGCGSPVVMMIYQRESINQLECDLHRNAFAPASAIIASEVFKPFIAKEANSGADISVGALVVNLIGAGTTY